MLNRTVLAAFLATSALAFGIDPASARRVAEDGIECSCPDARTDPHAACAREAMTKAGE